MHTQSSKPISERSIIEDTQSGPRNGRTLLIELAVVVIITLIAAALRFYKLGEWSWWVDEIFTLDDALDPTEKYHQFHYPLSYILIGFYLKQVGITEYAARLIPALFGIATIPAFYLLTRKSFGYAAALIGALFIAFSPWHLYWSQMARFYTMTMFFGAAAAFLFWLGLQKNSWKYMLLASVSMLLAFMSHYSAVLILAAIGCYCLLQLVFKSLDRPAGFNLRNILIFGGIFLLVPAAMIGRIHEFVLGYTVGNATTGTDWANPIKGIAYTIFSTGYRIGFGIALFSLATAAALLRKRVTAGLFLLCLAVVPPMLLAIAGAISKGENRYALVSLPAYTLLAGVGLVILVRETNPKTYSRFLAPVLGIALLMPMIQHDAFYFTSASNGERWNYKGAFNYIKSYYQPGDIILTPMTLPLQTYADGSGIEVEELYPDKKSEYEKSGKRYWIVVEDATRTRSAGSESAQWLADKTDLKINFPASSPVQNYGVSVYLLDARGREE